MTELWPGDDEDKPAPPPLRRIQALVNTVERPDGSDRLNDVADARPWLVDNDLLAASTELSSADLSLVVEVREALRALLVRNGGGPAPTQDALAPLRRVTAAVRPSVDVDGSVALRVDGDDVASRLAGLLLVVRDAQRDGSWARLKACGNDECRWAFYDASRNHGGTWCDMASCGNKLKNRQFRARKRAAR
ncbi:CGNR zinc finger domain-containing protein [Mycobacterium sp. 236(2023)]|uniref:CGNR zinc finger domain-containing protein n=1 Tax=Mycobacterium sp. 236(2023) TaxID=3038163 RepID=UPI0024158631|nr:CGNR zinc finger domain-containing protein [Mycobacterium sp. 236(2023)]MDG4666866.1 CGNR zinc finger domain-containing protein [Mycobacterium sp. 236(2023)]